MRTAPSNVPAKTTSFLRHRESLLASATTVYSIDETSFGRNSKAVHGYAPRGQKLFVDQRSPICASAPATSVMFLTTSNCHRNRSTRTKCAALGARPDNFMARGSCGRRWKPEPTARAGTAPVPADKATLHTHQDARGFVSSPSVGGVTLFGVPSVHYTH